MKIGFLVAIIATFGSLFFSEVMSLPPCKLCWYQRIFLFPLTFIFATGILREEKNSIWYALPLILVGLIISIYHNLLYFGIISQAIVPCTKEISCTSTQLEWLGFITIPLMSMFTFLMLLSLILIEIFKIRNKK